MTAGLRRSAIRLRSVEALGRTEDGLQEGSDATTPRSRSRRCGQPQTGLDTIASASKIGVARVTTFADPVDTVNAIKRLGEEVIAKL